MDLFRKAIFPILVSTIWISISEYVRNELLIKSSWENHYQSLGLAFPSDLINGMMWGIWSLLFAIAIYFISRRFTLLETTLLSWLMGFVLMWVVIWNLNVLPSGLLLIAVPLSLLEVFVATWINIKLSNQNRAPSS
jgi:hypothetical protein